MTKSELSRTALDLFSRYGIKSISMEYIANEANISKRTLYELFADKESLLIEGLNQDFDEFSSLVKKVEKDSMSISEVIIFFYNEMFMKSRSYTNKFFDDLKKFPNAIEQKNKHRKFLRERLTIWLQRGIKEGVFRDDINYNLLVSLTKGFMEKRIPSDHIAQYSYHDLYSTVFSIFIRGICTTKGVEIFDTYARKKKAGEIFQL